MDEVRLGRFLQRDDGLRLPTRPLGEARAGGQVVGNLTDQPLEGQLAHQQLGALLVLADLAQRDRARLVATLLPRARGRPELAAVRAHRRSSSRRQALATHDGT
eukprot:3098556-Prymnesium_polylepis.1